MTARGGPVLVLGASGRLGRMLRAVWPDDVPVIWQSRTPAPGNVCCHILNDPEELAAVVQGAGSIVCLAGVTDAYAQSTGADYHDNTRLALAAVRAAAHVGCSRVLLTSSAAVYGQVAGPIPENAPLKGTSDYARSKRDMEIAAQEEAEKHNLHVTCLRIGNVAGADAALGGWQPGCVMDQFEDGTTPRRSYIGPASLARSLAELSRAEALPAVLNVAAPGAVSMGDLLTVADRAWTPRTAPPTAMAELLLDVSTLNTLLEQEIRPATAQSLVAEWRNTLPAGYDA